MKYYFDCTFTYHSGLNTGIQRVVRNVISRDQIFRENSGIETSPVISFGNNYYEIDRAFVLNVKPVTASIGQKIKAWFDRVRQKVLKRFSVDTVAFNLMVKAFDSVEWLLKKMFWVIKTLRVFRTVLVSGNRKVDFEKSDKLILLDAFWTYEIAKSLDNTGLSRDQIYSVIYDLIPVTHPDFVEELIQPLFMKRLPELAARVKNFIGISNSVAMELTDYFAKNFSEQSFNIDYFLLGSDFKSRTKSSLSIKRPEFEDIFKSGPVWLVVGTIEPRKNHSFILDVFDELWKNDQSDRLLIIGRIGWKCDHLISRILHHPELNKKLFFFSDATDDELLYSYQNSKGLIFASFVEGFGLPIVEAIASGLRVFCSDIPVFKEVGADYPKYFPLDSSKPLIGLINKNLSDTTPPAKKWMTWDESAFLLFSKIISDKKRGLSART